MVTIKKKVLKVKNAILLLILVVLLIIAAIVGKNLIIKHFFIAYPKELLIKDKENAQFGQYKIRKEKHNENYYVLHYPKTDIPQLEKWIKTSMDETIETLQAQLQDPEKENHIKQEFISSTSFDHYSSVYLKTSLNGEVISESARTFNINTQSFLNADLFNSKGLRFIKAKLQNTPRPQNITRSEFIKENDLDPALENLFLKDYELTFILPHSKTSLNLDEFADGLNQDFESITKGNEDMVPSVYLDYGYEKEDKLIALTFDDGPYSVNTFRILEILEKYDAKATFFMLGSRVSGEEDTLKALLDQGHQIASHSYNHPDFSSLSLDEINKQLQDTENEFKRATGFEGEIYVRPPYGALNFEDKEKLNYVFVNWSVDTNDWRYRDKDIVCQSTLEDARDGAIILMHELYDSSVEALDCLIPKLKEEGYQFVSVKELFEAKEIDVQKGQLYYSGN